MGLNPGNEECTDGLAKELHDFWIKPEEEGGMGASDTVVLPIIDPATGQQTGVEEKETTVKRFCFNLARIIIDHILDNMEIKGIQTIGEVTTHIEVDTTSFNDHEHEVTGDFTASDVALTQSADDTTGHVA